VVWPTGLDRPPLKAKAIENGSYFNSFPFDEVILLRDLLVQMVNNVVRHSDDTTQVIPESFLVNQQLPAFVGRYLEREDSFQDNAWALTTATGPVTLTRDVDWALRLVEAGPTIIQKYESRPLLADGKKLLLQLSLFVKQIAPLQAAVSRKVQVLAAKEPFSAGIDSLSNPDVQVCTEALAEGFFDQIPNSAVLYDKAVESIRTMLKCFQAEFGDSIAEDPQSHLRRAIWSVDIQCDEDYRNALILGVSFSPAANVDYNQAFRYLFTDD